MPTERTIMFSFALSFILGKLSVDSNSPNIYYFHRNGDEIPKTERKIEFPFSSSYFRIKEEQIHLRPLGSFSFLWWNFYDNDNYVSFCVVIFFAPMKGNLFWHTRYLQGVNYTVCRNTFNFCEETTKFLFALYKRENCLCFFIIGVRKKYLVITENLYIRAAL